jgi:triosephosphate isomerase
MRRPIVAGNWKMHGSRSETAALIEELLARCPAAPATCVICPPFVYLYEAGRLLRDSAPTRTAHSPARSRRRC